jgi:O-antigen/teichoic acid export membrane protein
MFISGMQIINTHTDIIMLGTIKGAEAAGIYSIVNRGAALITFVLFAVNVPLAPVISSLYAAKDMKRLQHVITKSSRIILLYSLPIGISLIVFRNWFLLLFGQEFTQGETALIILSIAQLFSAAMGSVGLPLIMTGHERNTAIIVGSSAMLSVVLNVILIPKWGLEGAATATACNIIIRNILSAIWVYKKLGISSIAMGEIGLFKKNNNKQ